MVGWPVNLDKNIMHHNVRKTSYHNQNSQNKDTVLWPSSLYNGEYLYLERLFYIETGPRYHVTMMLKQRLEQYLQKRFF